MIRATNHSSFPRVGENPLDQQLRRLLKRRERGAATEEELLEAIDEVTTMSVAEQSRAFIDIVTDGMIRWEGPLSHLAAAVDGLKAAELRRWFHTNFYDRRVEVVGEIARRGSLLEHDYKVAEGVSLTRPVKPVLIGPVTFARLCRDRHYGSLEQVAMAMAEVQAQEFAHLASIGASCFQLDEPMLCRFPEDAALLARTAGRVFEAAGPDATTILSTYFGDLGELSDQLEQIPGTHLGLDLVTSEANFALLDRLPRDRGVFLGLFDATSSRQEDAADVALRLEPYRASLCARDVLVGPNAGLDLLTRDQAFDKLLHARYLVEKLGQEWSWD